MSADAALVELLRALRDRDYRFTAVTPATHARVLARPARPDCNLRDIFGWNRPFERRDLDDELFQLLAEAGAVERLAADRFKSSARIASLGNALFLHSGFPTDDEDSVFFGPDTYRFVRFVQRELADIGEVRRAVDMGAGGGAGGITLARDRAGPSVALVDVNERALGLAKANAAAAKVNVEYIQSDRIPSGADLIIANPPYLMDSRSRAYRDGGELLGGAVALDWVRQALDALEPGGTMLLYTGAAYTDGSAPLLDAVGQACAGVGAKLRVEEIDPDVFGEELDETAYREVERIAAVGIVIRR